MRVLITLLCLVSSFAFSQSLLEQMRSNLQLGYYSSAAQIVGPALIAQTPDDAEAHYLYSYALYLTDNYDLARTELDKALALGPQPADPEYDRLNGLLYANSGDYTSAKRLLRNAFIRSQSYTIAMDWARIAWQSGDFQEALEAYNNAAHTPDGSKELWPLLDRGRILKDLGQYDAAIQAFNDAIAVFEANDPGGLPSPGYVEAFYRLGETYELLENYSQAKANYEAAISVDSSYAPASEALRRLVLRGP